MILSGKNNPVCSQVNTGTKKMCLYNATRHAMRVTFSSAGLRCVLIQYNRAQDAYTFFPASGNTKIIPAKIVKKGTDHVIL